VRRAALRSKNKTKSAEEEKSKEVFRGWGQRTKWRNEIINNANRGISSGKKLVSRGEKMCSKRRCFKCLHKILS
jgi:hypothetical protein